MKEDIDINAETTSKYDVKADKSKKNIWGIYIGICLILIGILWYAINMGLIPVQYLQSWPQILIVFVGILVLIKSIK